MNEPAFPGKSATEFKDTAGNTVFKNETGMTLRDYFAAKAMQALLGVESWRASKEQVIAKRSYQEADSMLKSRTEPKGE